MKRIFACFVCIALLAFSGCAGEAPVATTATPFQTTAPTREPSVPESTAGATLSTQPGQSQEPKHPLSALSMAMLTEFKLSEAKEVILRTSLPNISLTNQDPFVAEAVIIDLRGRVEQAAADAQSIAQSSDGQALGYFREVSAEVGRMDQGVLSVVLTHSSYTGGMRPNSWLESASYDLLTGKCLALPDILAPGVDGEALLGLVLDSLSQLEGLYSNYDETVSELFRGDAMPESWYLSDEGLCFFFDTYDIAPYAAGPVRVCIPYGSLTGVVKDVYFPPEVLPADGVLGAVAFEEADLDTFSRFTELILDPIGSRILLFPDGTITDIRIEQGRWDYADGTFYPVSTIFACPVLYAGDGLTLIATVGESSPELRVMYTSGGERITKYLSCLDGSPILTD